MASRIGGLPVSRQAVSKHIGVLDQVGLGHATRSGRERIDRIDRAQLARATGQLAAVSQEWDARLHRIKGIAESMQRQRDS